MASEPVLLLAEKNSSRFVVFHDLREEPNGFGLVFHGMELGPPPAEGELSGHVFLTPQVL